MHGLRKRYKSGEQEVVPESSQLPSVRRQGGKRGSSNKDSAEKIGQQRNKLPVQVDTMVGKDKPTIHDSSDEEVQLSPKPKKKGKSRKKKGNKARTPDQASKPARQPTNVREDVLTSSDDLDEAFMYV